MTVEGKEVDLGKIKSVKLTLDVEFSKEEFDKLLMSMSNVKTEKKEKKQ